MIKKYFLIFLLFCFVASCNSPTEPEDTTPYSRVFVICQNDNFQSYHIEYSSLDSLPKFQKIDFTVNAESWVVLPSSFISDKHDRYILATLTKVNFFDTRKPRLLKTITITFDGFFDEMMGIPTIKFVELDENNVLLLLHTTIYIVNIPNMVCQKIFDAKVLGMNVEIKQMKKTSDNKSIFIITRTVGLSELIEKLYKIDIESYGYTFIDEISRGYGGGTVLGITNSSLICLNKDKQKLVKYDIVQGKKILEKSISKEFTNTFQIENISTTSDEILVFFNAYDFKFYSLDPNKLEYLEYWEMENNNLGGYQEIGGQLLCFFKTNGTTKIYSLKNKKILYQFTLDKASYPLIIGGTNEKSN